MRTKTILLILLFGVFVGGLFLLSIWRTDGNVHTVELREDGFSPQEVIIEKGDTVQFVSKNGTLFWPASSLHPSHGIYSEFDPREPVLDWSFSFEKEGVWKYHNHLSPLFVGTVIVGKKTFDVQYAFSCDTSGGEQRQCWQETIQKTLQETGIADAFEVVASLYNSELEFARDCHGYVHEIGEEAYELFAAGKEIELSPKTSFCGYGFYHGFMETLLLTTGDVGQGREFCKYVDEQLYLQKFGAAAACYHGVGHGAVDGGDPRVWGNVDAMIAPGFEFCQAFAETNFQEYLCATGIFNAIEILSIDPKYELEELQKDPFSLCHVQEEKYREACYTNMIPVILRIANNDFAKAASVIEEDIPQDEDYEIRNIVLSGLFHEFLRLHLSEPAALKEAVTLCRSLKAPLHLSCIDGLSGGHMKYGKPDEEYVQGLAFCSSGILSNKEQEVCFEHILSRLRVWYSQEQSGVVCQTVPEEYRKLCNS